MTTEIPHQPAIPDIVSSSIPAQEYGLPNAVDAFPASPEHGAVYFTPPMAGRRSEAWRELSSDERERQLTRRLEMKEDVNKLFVEEYMHHRNESETDALTRLPNYRSLNEAVNRAVKEEQEKDYDPRESRLFILNIDVDQFKAVNDTLGHDMGDRVLQQFAKLGDEIVLEAIKMLELREGARLFRKSGDEFYILGRADITGNSQRHTQTPEEQVTALSERIRNAVNEKLANVKEVVSGFGVSIGQVLHNPGEDAEAFLKRSDMEMYKQKNSKKTDDALGR